MGSKQVLPTVSCDDLRMNVAHEVEARSGLGARIIFIPYLDGFGGVERLALILSEFLHNQNVTHQLLCFRNSMRIQDFATWPVSVIELNPRRNVISEGMALRGWLSRRSANGDVEGPVLAFDIKGAFYAGIGARSYVVHLTDPPSLLSKDISKRAPSLSGSFRLAATAVVRAPLVAARAEIVHRLNSMSLRKALGVITMTTRIADELRSLYGVDPIVIRPGVPRASNPLAAKRSTPSRIRILSVSRLEKSKRISWILDALGDLERAPNSLSSTIDWHFDIVGTGSLLPELKAIAIKNEIEKRVEFHGYLSDDAMEELFQGADVFVIPAVQGYGLPALEALQRGVAVILHESSGVSEILSQTPWVEVLHDSNGDDVAPALLSMIGKVVSGQLVPGSQPVTPTADEWTRNICDACGWTVSTENIQP